MQVLVFVQGKMVDIRFCAGFDVLFCFPVSLVLLNSNINTYSSRRGRRIDLERAEHSVVKVPSVFGATASSDSRGGVIPALLVLLGIASEETSEGGNDNGEVADGQGNAGLEGTNNSLPNTGESNDEDSVGEGGDSSDNGAGEDRYQAESDRSGDPNVSENPVGGNDQEDV